MARPAVLVWTRNHPGSDWVQVDIAQEHEEVFVDVDKKRVVAVLKQMPCRRDAFLYLASKPRPDPLHQYAEWEVGDLDEQVNVIRHPTIRVNSCARGFQRCRDYLLQGQIVHRSAKQRLLMIATCGHVVEPSGNEQPGPSRHGLDSRTTRSSVA